MMVTGTSLGLGQLESSGQSGQKKILLLRTFSYWFDVAGQEQ